MNLDARALFIPKALVAKLFQRVLIEAVVNARAFGKRIANASLNSTGNYVNVDDFRRRAKYPWDAARFRAYLSKLEKKKGEKHVVKYVAQFSRARIKMSVSVILILWPF